MKCGSAYAEVTKHTDPLTSAAIPPSVINSRLHMKIPGKQGKLMLLKSAILDKKITEHNLLRHLLSRAEQVSFVFNRRWINICVVFVS